MFDAIQNSLYRAFSKGRAGENENIEVKSDLPLRRPSEFPEIDTRVQFAIDCTEQRFNAVFFAHYASDSNSVSFKWQLIRFVKREHGMLLRLLRSCRSFGTDSTATYGLLAFLKSFYAPFVGSVP